MSVLNRKTPTVSEKIYRLVTRFSFGVKNQLQHRIGYYIGPYAVVPYDPIMKSILENKDTRAKYERYSSAQNKPVPATDSENKNPEAIGIDYVRRIRNSLSDFNPPQYEFYVSLTDVIQPSCPRAKDDRRAKAIQDEDIDLLRPNTFRLTFKEEHHRWFKRTYRLIFACKQVEDRR